MRECIEWFIGVNLRGDVSVGDVEVACDQSPPLLWDKFESVLQVSSWLSREVSR